MMYNVLDYGAVGNGSSSDTAAIQRAIDVCAENGGGRVLLPGGHVYRSGMLVLRSFVELHLENGAVLKASDRLEELSPSGSLAPETSKGLAVPTYENCDYAGEPQYYFIYAKDAEYVSVTGQGIIDGNESIFYGKITPWHIDGSFYPRAPLLCLIHVEHLTLWQCTLQNSAFWTTHLIGCRDVLIEGIRIRNNLRLANCDGIDPDHCQGVRILGCTIEGADDCIVFKNTEKNRQYGPCENIVVSGCTLKSTSAAVKIGTESEGVFRNIIVENCNITGTNRGISLMLRDSGRIENALFANINIETRQFSKEHWWGEAEPIAVTAVRRRKDTQIGTIRNVRFSNIACDSENGILIYGDDPDNMNISELDFENISLRIRKKTDWPKNYHDLRPTWRNSMQMDSLKGLYAKHCSGIRFRNFRLVIEENMREYVSQPIDTEGAEVTFEQSGTDCCLPGTNPADHRQ